MEGVVVKMDVEEEEEKRPLTLPLIPANSSSTSTDSPNNNNGAKPELTDNANTTNTNNNNNNTNSNTPAIEWTQFEKISESLNLDKETQQSAWALLQQLATRTMETAHSAQHMIACALYIASKSSEPSASNSATPSSTSTTTTTTTTTNNGASTTTAANSSANGVALSQLLRAADIRLVEFFTPLKAFIRALGLGAVHEEQLQNLEKKFCVISILYKKYNKEFGQLFHLPSTRGDGNPDESTEVFALFSFGWTLFLVAKGKLLADPPDLVNAFNLLLCCLGFLLTNAPPHLKKTGRFMRRSDSMNKGLRAGSVGILAGNNLISGPIAAPGSGDETTDTLSFLADQSGANLNEVLAVEERLFQPFMAQLKEGDFLSEKNERNKRSSVISNKRLLRAGESAGALTRSSIERNTKLLNREYELMYHRSGDFDERQFLAVNEIGTPSRLSAQYLQYYDYNNRGGVTPSPAPMTGEIVPRTPMASVLHNVSWLSDNLSQREDSPSATLKRFFGSCEINPESEIVARVSQSIALFPSGEGEAVSDEAETSQRRAYGAKLYYKVLEAMLLAEEDRLLRSNKEVNFSTLLSHPTFHTSLLACCMEIIFYSFRMIDHAFPAVLSIFKIHAFDFFKVIESVIRYEYTLPRAVVRHLIRIEENVLESIAWQEGSPLFALLENTTHRQALIALASSSLGGSSQHTIPVSPAKPTQAATPQRAGNSQSLQHFFRKLFQLASERARSVCTQLLIRPDIFVQIWNALVSVLIEHSALMQDRHLDQLLLCVVYGVCKVNKLRDIAFRKILEKYRQLPHATPKIYRGVVLSSKEETGDIIKFYNSIFIPRLEGFLMQFTAPPSATGGATGAASPGPSVTSSLASPFTMTALTPSSPFAVPQSPLRLGSNMSVSSPMRDGSSRMPTPRTNTPRVLYNFGQSPLKDLQTINRAVNSPMRPAQSPVTPQKESRAKRHLFDDEPSTASTSSTTTTAPTTTTTSAPTIPASLQRKLNDLASAASMLEVVAGSESQQTQTDKTGRQGDAKRRKLRHHTEDAPADKPNGSENAENQK